MHDYYVNSLGSYFRLSWVGYDSRICDKHNPYICSSPLWSLSDIPLTRSFVSIPTSTSNEIMLQQVREVIKTLKEQLM